MESAPQDRSGRPNELNVDVAAAGKRIWVGCAGSLSRQRARLSTCDCFCGPCRCAAQSIGNWTFSHVMLDLSSEIFQPALRDKDLARRSANGKSADWSHSPEEAHA